MFGTIYSCLCYLFFFLQMFEVYLKLEQAKSQLFERHTVRWHMPTFSVKHFTLLFRPPSPFFFQQGFGDPQCYHSSILFESGRV